MASFSELGIPFPLFEAPTTEAAEYVGLAECAICSGEGRHCFRPDNIIVRCPDCGTENPRVASPYHGTMGDFACRSCGCLVTTTERLGIEGGPAICYDCLRSGMGAFNRATEYGMVSHEAAERGFAESHPNLKTCPFELVPPDTISDDPHSMDNWSKACIPKADMWELIRTPGYFGWQDEQWLFCCRRPMTYVGNWKNMVNSGHRTTDERALFDSLVAAGDHPEFVTDDSLWRAVLAGSCEMYVFQCRACEGYRGHWDCC